MNIKLLYSIVLLLILAKMQKINHLLPTTVTDDTVLNKYFKHSVFPHYIWIDKSGKIIAITDGNEINETNILKVISGRKLSTSPKIDNEYLVSYADGAFI